MSTVYDAKLTNARARIDVIRGESEAHIDRRATPEGRTLPESMNISSTAGD